MRGLATGVRKGRTSNSHAYKRPNVTNSGNNTGAQGGSIAAINVESLRSRRVYSTYSVAVEELKLSYYNEEIL